MNMPLYSQNLNEKKKSKSFHDKVNDYSERKKKKNTEKFILEHGIIICIDH